MRHAPCQDFPACAAASHGSVTGAGSRKATGVRGQHLRPPPRQRGPTHGGHPNLRHCGRRRTRRCARNDASGEIATQTPEQRAEKARQALSLPRRHPRPSDARHLTLLEQRAQGRPGAGRRPWSACNKKHAAEPQAQPRSPGLPCAMVLRLIRALPGDRLVGPVADDTSSPTWHQHRDARTTRLPRRTGIVRPREQARAASLCAHRIPHPTSVTIAKRPLNGTGCAE